MKFKCSVGFKFYGVGIFERYNEPPGEFTLCYWYEILDEGNHSIFKSEQISETVNYLPEEVNEMHVF